MKSSVLLKVDLFSVFRNFLLTHIHLIEMEVKKLQQRVYAVCCRPKAFLQAVFTVSFLQYKKLYSCFW